MFKLIKYEFRKSLTLLLILLGITAALEIYFLGALKMQDEVHLAISMSLLMMATFVVALFALVRGVTSYSAEMKERSAYLIFMTPNSGLKIMGSKFLYTFFNGLLFATIYVFLGILDIGIVLQEIGELEEFMQALKEALMEVNMGVHFDQILLAALAFAIYFFLSVLSVVALTYIAITLSHTLFRDKKWRGFAAVAIFFGLNWIVGQINGMLPTVYDQLVYVESAAAVKIQDAYGIETGLQLKDLLLAMLPQGCLSLGVILVSLFGCAWMLDKKVSL